MNFLMVILRFLFGDNPPINARKLQPVAIRRDGRTGGWEGWTIVRIPLLGWLTFRPLTYHRHLPTGFGPDERFRDNRRKPRNTR